MTSIIKRNAKFVDNNGNPQTAIITINPGIFIGIDSFDKNNTLTGYASMHFHPNNRFLLDVIYCLDKFRGNGIATMISELADYIMKEYEGYVIRGVFKPTQMGTDRRNNVVRSELELDTAARRFYATNGYEVINYDDYISAPEEYPYLNFMDFQRGEEIAKTLVAKVIVPKEYSFIESNDVIYSRNYEVCKQKKL